MNVQTYPDPLIPGGELMDIPSGMIKGRRKGGADVAMKPGTMDFFWRQAIRAIRRSPYSDMDGRVFTSEEMDVRLGPYDVDIRHTYRWEEHRGGDSYMGFTEPYAELVESFEVDAVFESFDDTPVRGLAARLNEYYRRHERELLK